MEVKNLSVDDIVKARCATCRRTANHTVIAIVEEGKVRMECNSCRGISLSGEAKDSKPSAKTLRKKAVSRRSKAAQSAAEGREWASMRPRLRQEDALPYQLDGCYHARNVLQHPIFGLGLVVREAGPHKIEVLFEGGKKLLCCH